MKVGVGRWGLEPKLFDFVFHEVMIPMTPRSAVEYHHGVRIAETQRLGRNPRN